MKKMNVILMVTSILLLAILYFDVLTKKKMKFWWIFRDVFTMVLAVISIFYNPSVKEGK
jgi:hypothetical protein